MITSMLPHQEILENCKLQQRPGNTINEPTVVYTQDCLSDYYQLKTAGIQFISGPHYTERGLMAEFTDCHGTLYQMLEERSYEDEQ